MKTSRPNFKRAQVPAVFLLPVLALTLGPAAEAGAERSAMVSGCNGYDRCPALGKELLAENNPEQAIDAFKQAAGAAGTDETRRAEAYGRVAEAEGRAGDSIAAVAYYEHARSLSPSKDGWIESAYKQALAKQGTLSAADIRKKLAVDREIAANEPPLQRAGATAEETGAADAPGYTAELGQTRGIGLDMAMVGDNAKYAPRPRKAAKAAPKPVSAAPALKAAPSKPVAETKPGAGPQFVLLGHTETVGSEEYNLSLSRDRAETVKAYLTGNFPDLAGTLRAEGVGKRYPLFDTQDEMSHRLNRRVAVKQLR